MRRRPPHIPQRRRVFLGCEGQSEHGYGTLIAHIAREIKNLHVHIDARVLQPGAGDPRALVDRAAQVIARDEARREPFELKAVLLDLGNAEINAAAAVRAERHGIQYLIWQLPDHEGLLLRHLPNCQQSRPPRGGSLVALRGQWPEYEKPMSAARLATRIALDQIRQASTVEPALREFLTAIGLLQ
jgi:hypothetical protein